MSRITLAPLPQWRLLLKSIFTQPLNGRELAKPWLIRDSDVPFWFSRSAFAMLAIARWYEVYTQKKLPPIWIPDFFCNQSLQPLREANYRFYFYPITDRLTPDWASCDTKALTNKPAIFILVHYFGYPSEGKQARQFCNKQGCILVEDAAHVFVPHHDIGVHGEFVFYSPHKHLAIPDGALLIQRPRTKVFRKLNDKQPTEVMGQILKTIPQESPTPWAWLFKRILQKFLPDVLWLKGEVAEKDSNTPPTSMPFKQLQSKFSRNLLTTQLPNINKYALVRQTNEAIFKALNQSVKETAPFESDGYYVPYMGCFRCKTGESAREHLSFLKESRSPVMKWPDLPHEVLDDPANHLVAIELEKTLFFFPVHQSLRSSEMQSIYKSFCRYSEKKSSDNCINVVWYSGEKKEWEDWLAAAGKSNLLQSWEYGNAKKEIEGWQIRRGVIKRNGAVVAIFQALEKSWGPVGVLRINRGPLIINGVDDFYMKYNFFKLLRKTWNWWKGSVLLIAPELLNVPENIGVLSLARFRKREALPWVSSFIDLSLAETDLRKNLNGKWRNQLKKAEQSSLDLKVEKSDEAFYWMLDHYEQLMKEKSFRGPSVELYKELYRLKRNDFYVFRAWSAGQAVAGILIVKHGKSCTYQLGWNSSEGRRVYANNLLIWHAIIELKKHGCAWFDLGGIDEINTSGIAKFKRGIGGFEYGLIGEWY
jgi:lipid II:glycine glycyltransferase (peptidoglycan interpeptide bridge formation enzyme)